MTHPDHLVPSHLGDHRDAVPNMGTERIILARAPGRFTPSTAIEGDHFAIVGERARDPDPVIGVEIGGAVHDHNGGLPTRPEGTIEDRDVAGVHSSGAVFVRHGFLSLGWNRWQLSLVSAVADLSGIFAGRRMPL